MEHTTTNSKPYVGRPSQQKIADMISEYEESGFSVEDYCEYKGLNPDTFTNWLNRHQQKASDRPAFVPVTIREEEDLPSGGLFAEYRGLKFYQPMSAEFFKALIGG